MALNRSVTITSTSAKGDTVKTNVGYITNRKLSENEGYKKLQNWLQAMNGLTTNTYIESTVTETQPLSELVESNAAG